MIRAPNSVDTALSRCSRDKLYLRSMYSVLSGPSGDEGTTILSDANRKQDCRLACRFASVELVQFPLTLVCFRSRARLFAAEVRLVISRNLAVVGVRVMLKTKFHPVEH